MEYLARILAALPLEDRLSLIEEVMVTGNNTDFPDTVQQWIEKQKIRRV